MFRVTIGGSEKSDRQLTMKSNGGPKKMNSIQRFAISVVSIAAFTCVVGCGSSTKEVDTTTYVPAEPAQVVVQPAPAETVPLLQLRRPTHRASGHAVRVNRSMGAVWTVSEFPSQRIHNRNSQQLIAAWGDSAMRNKRNRKRTAVATLAIASLIGGNVCRQRPCRIRHNRILELCVPRERQRKRRCGASLQLSG